MDENEFAAEWDRVFVEKLNSNPLLGSLKGRVTFVLGAAFVLNRLGESDEDYGELLDHLRDELQHYYDGLPWPDQP